MEIQNEQNNGQNLSPYDIIAFVIALAACIGACIACISTFSAAYKCKWTCSCGNENIGKFCTECGAEKSEANVAASWTCSCGNVNKGKFCSECGAENPVDVLVYKCDRCGCELANTKNPPKFCPECGEPFTESSTELS